MLAAVLLIVSFLINPGWVIPFLQSSFADLHTDYGFTSGAFSFVSGRRLTRISCGSFPLA